MQTHSGLFLEELEMMVPSTPTSASGAFWKGNELGSEQTAQPAAAPSTTSEVVKSKSASYWPALSACLEGYHFIKHTHILLARWKGGRGESP